MAPSPAQEDSVTEEALDFSVSGRGSSTLYPKITGKVADILSAIDNLRFQSPNIKLPQDLPFTGTVKLHGTHGDVRVYPDGSIVCQSRNRVTITPQSDNDGFAFFVHGRQPALRRLAGRIQERWRFLHPHGTLPVKEPIILAGEWIGKGIQKGVAICQLPRRFVVCSIHVAAAWQPIELYADLSDQSEGFFNIGLGGYYHLILNTENEGEGFLAEAKHLTLEVATSCPFARALGVEGVGEGIVWTPSPNSALPNISEFWLKTKSETFAASAYQVKDALAKQADVRARCRLFAEATATPVRLDQGWQYLAEMGIERNKLATGQFLGWMVNDIEIEEKTVIHEECLGNAWKREVSRMAVEWYQKRLREG